MGWLGGGGRGVGGEASMHLVTISSGGAAFPMVIPRGADYIDINCFPGEQGPPWKSTSAEQGKCILEGNKRCKKENLGD